AAIALAAGCGGGGGGKNELSTATYQKQVNAAVVQVKGDLRAYDNARSRAKVRGALDTLKTATAKEATGLSQLKPAQKARSVNRQLVATFRAMQQSFARALARPGIDRGAASAGEAREDDLDK